MTIKGFVVFEGIDGAGTTTQLKKLKEKFGRDEIFITAEPTSSETGLFLRKMLRGEFTVDRRTSAYLFAADRCEHVYGKDGIIENAEKGRIVASDRYFFSSLAYQGSDGEDDLPSLLNSPFPLPELLFFFRIRPEVSLKRVMDRGGNLEIYEKIDFQKKTAENFERIIADYDGTEKGRGMRVVVIDAEKSPEEIERKIFEEIKKTRG